MQSTYIHEVRLPAHYHADQQYPVIFALHGMGSDEQDMLRLMEPLQSDFIIVAVRADRPRRRLCIFSDQEHWQSNP